MPSIISKKNIFLVLATLTLLTFTSIFYLNKIFSPHFVDEEDNFVLGKYLIEDKKLYSDLFSHHQPLLYIASSIIQKATDPKSIYMLIKRHREMVVLWSTIWALVLVFNFKWVAFYIISILEVTKIYLLGNLFLAEALIIYPLIYLVLKVFYDSKFSKKELLFLGLIFSLLIFSLAPIWPLLLLSAIIFSIKVKKYRPFNLLFIMVGFFPLFLLSVYFSSIKDYFINVFYINFVYYIPLGKDVPLPQGFLLGIFTPIIALLKTGNPGLIWVIKLLSLALFLNLFILWRLKLINIKKILLIFLLLGLANIRYVDPSNDYYRGFHLLPWYGLLITFMASTSAEILNKLKPKLKIYPLVLLSLITVMSFYASLEVLFNWRDKNNDFDINYSRQFTFGEAVNIMKEPGDKMFVVPDEWLIYWQADIEPASKMVNYYHWMVKTPPLKQEVDNMFAFNKPAFIYCNCGEEYELNKYFNEYQQIKKDNKLTPLYVLPEKYKNLKTNQIEKLTFLGFNVN